MDLYFVSPKDEPYSKKPLCNMKGTHSNGFMLQIKPSFADPHGENKSCVFKHCSFSESNVLALTDTYGNMYMIDLEMHKYWQIPSRGTVSVLSFPRVLKSRLLIALNTGCIQILNIETGTLTGTLIGHSMPAKEISYAHDGKYCLSSNSTEAIIWDMLSYSQTYRLLLKDDILLRKALFVPVCNNIFACFTDDAMHMWKFGNFESIQQITPEDWKIHHIKSVAFTKNGHLMAIGGNNPNIIVFCLDEWSVKKNIEISYAINGVKYMEFISQIFDDGANRILGILTRALEICFLDIETSVILKKISDLHQLVGSFCASSTGKFLACILISGEVNIYVSEKLLTSDKNIPVCSERGCKSIVNVSDCGRVTNRKSKAKWIGELAAVHNELKVELNVKKLVPILKQFGEYPEAYRVIIWRTILQLPLNREAFISIACKECHPSWINLESKYPLVNRALSNALKRVLSSLSFWCPLFGEVEFLPEFVFPFIKLLHFDPFVCFELVATVIKNWCQNWFEFYPFPPINILSQMENLLAHHDPDLLEFYFTKNVTCSVYACILMQTAFSEVLTKNQWLKLWDHILSNEPSFNIMAVVTYNIICRNGIKNCATAEDVEEFFHRQNAIDMKLFISKCYHFKDKTPPEIHPRRYLSSFSPLEKGDIYIPYENYPKLIIDKNATKLHLIQKEEQTLLEEERKMIAMRKELDERLRTDERAGTREEILMKLDDKFRGLVNAEEDRISAQRKKLQQLKNELRLKELAVLKDAREELVNKRSQKREREMKRLLHDLAVREAREQSEFEAIEDMGKYYAGLLLRKYQLKMDLKMKNGNHMKKIADHLKEKEGKLKEELEELRNEITDPHQHRRTEIASKIFKATDILQNIEAEIEMEMIDTRINSELDENKIEMQNLWKELQALEKKFERLLCKETVKDGHTTVGKSAGTSSFEEKCSLRDTPKLICSNADESESHGSPTAGSSSPRSKSSINSVNFDSKKKKDCISSNISGNCAPDGAYMTDEIFDGNGNGSHEMKFQKSEKRKLWSFRNSRSKFTDSSKIPSLSSMYKMSNSLESLMEDDSQHRREIRNVKKGIKNVHHGPKGEENISERFSHASLTSATLDKFLTGDFFPIGSSPYSTYHRNSAVEKAFSERRNLIEKAKRRQSAS